MPLNSLLNVSRLFYFDSHDWILSRKVLELLGSLKGKVVGDIGCGWGNFTRKLAKDAKIVYGVDIRKDVIKRIKSLETPNMKFMYSDAQKLPFKDNFFDVLVYRDVLEHVQDDNKALFEAVRVLKRGGIIVISVPNRYFVENYRFPIAKVLRKTPLRKYHVMASGSDNISKNFFNNYDKYVGHKHFYSIADFQKSKRFKIVDYCNIYNGISKYCAELLSFKGNFSTKRKSFIIIKVLNMIFLFPSLLLDEMLMLPKNVQGFGLIVKLKKIQ